MTTSNQTTLRSIADIKAYFATRERACTFISPSNFNMLGMHEWVKGWTNVNMLDCFDGAHPQVVVVKDDHTRVFEGMEDVNHYLTLNPGVQSLLSQKTVAQGAKGQVLFLFFDPYLEEVCEGLGVEIALPKNSLVREVDSKIVTTEIGNQAGVRSVPNVLAHVGSYADLQRVAAQAELGARWVVQTAYGDSGKTTFFIASEEDYERAASQIESEDIVKVMKWVRCAGTAVEACATRWGTFVGPLLTELIGVESLTPYAGGWCGNENYSAAFSAELRALVQQKTRAMGEALYQRGYRGTFELDYLLDLDTQEVYLGEMNSRITGVTAITNTSVFSNAHIPLFLFHLLEYDENVQLELDVKAFNAAMLADGAAGISAQVILKYTDDMLKVITRAPASGVYERDADGRLALKKAGYSRAEALGPDQVFVLRIQAEQEYAYHGGDLAIMFLNQVIRTPEGGMNPDGERWVAALKDLFEYRHLTQDELSLVALAHNPANVKSGQVR
jgi:hypothetical protein